MSVSSETKRDHMAIDTPRVDVDALLDAAVHLAPSPGLIGGLICGGFIAAAIAGPGWALSGAALGAAFGGWLDLNYKTSHVR